MHVHAHTHTQVCDLEYHREALGSIKLPLPADNSLVVVLKAILGQVCAVLRAGERSAMQKGHLLGWPGNSPGK